MCYNIIRHRCLMNVKMPHKLPPLSFQCLHPIYISAATVRNGHHNQWHLDSARILLMLSFPNSIVCCLTGVADAHPSSVVCCWTGASDTQLWPSPIAPWSNRQCITAERLLRHVALVLHHRIACGCSKQWTENDCVHDVSALERSGCRVPFSCKSCTRSWYLL